MGKATHPVTRPGGGRCSVRRRHVLWLVASIIAAALVLALLSYSAAGQTQRSVEVIERALAGLPFDRITAIADYIARLPNASISEANVDPAPPPEED